MKKMMIVISIVVLVVSVQAKSFTYEDLYGEIQVNMALANNCLEEVAFSQSVDGQNCSLYANVLSNTSVYKRLLKRDFSDFNSKGTLWTKDDWVILQNEMKKLIYTTELIHKNKY